MLAVVWDWNWLKRPLEHRISAVTGRSFLINGPLEVELGRVIVIRASDLSLANLPWSLTPEMAQVDLLRVEIPFARLVRGHRQLSRIDLVRPALLLERNARGTSNWQGLLQRNAPAPRPRVRWQVAELRIHEGALHVRDVPFRTRLQLTVDSTPKDRDSRSVRLLARGNGVFRGEAFRLAGVAESPVAFARSPGASYRIDVSARAGATRARLHGALQAPVDPDRFTLLLDASGTDLADLYPLLGLALPSTPPYRVSGSFEREVDVLRLHEMRGQIGDSDVSGDLSVDLGGRKPMIRGDLVSSNLDLDDLGGFIGVPPSARPGETASTEQRAAAKRRAANPRLLPDRDYDLRKLASLDADVRLRAKKVDAGKWPVQSLAWHLRLQDSLLRLDPFHLGIAGGVVDGKVRFDARKPPIDARADVVMQRLDLAAVWPTMQPPNVGLVNGSITLAGHGNSIAAMLGSADGSMQFGMGRGRFSNLLLELAGLDVAESLKFLLGKDRTVPVRCAYGLFEVDDGLMRARALAFDTSDTVLFGSGKVNLQQETLALELRPEPKDMSPLSLRGPLEISGTLKDPEFQPKMKPLLARAAAAVALYAIAPPAALLALVETGPGEDTTCLPGTRDPVKR